MFWNSTLGENFHLSLQSSWSWSLTPPSSVQAWQTKNLIVQLNLNHKPTHLGTITLHSSTVTQSRTKLFPSTSFVYSLLVSKLKSFFFVHEFLLWWFFKFYRRASMNNQKQSRRTVLANVVEIIRFSLFHFRSTTFLLPSWKIPQNHFNLFFSLLRVFLKSLLIFYPRNETRDIFSNQNCVTIALSSFVSRLLLIFHGQKKWKKEIKDDDQEASRERRRRVKGGIKVQ